MGKCINSQAFFVSGYQKTRSPGRNALAARTSPAMATYVHGIRRAANRHQRSQPQRLHDGGRDHRQWPLTVAFV